MSAELHVISDFYDFMLWLIRHTEKFPRHHRYSLGAAMENRMQTILALLLRAKYSKARRGLPIGNLTSQWFANWMLNPLDHHLTSHLRIGGYVRYCDDFILLHDDRLRLRGALEEIKSLLARIRLGVHEGKASVKPRLASWMAHARQANSERLIRRLSREWRFQRDGTDQRPCSSWRLVEQQ